MQLALISMAGCYQEHLPDSLRDPQRNSFMQTPPAVAFKDLTVRVVKNYTFSGVSKGEILCSPSEEERWNLDNNNNFKEE